MALSHVVSKIVNVEKYRNLEIPVKGQSRSLKLVPFDRLYGFPLVSRSDLEIWVRGHSRSSEQIRIDPPPMTSY